MDPSDQPVTQGLLDREIVCLLGLPIDVIDMAGAIDKVRHAVATRQRLFLSTPNLNFLVAAQKDEAFRESVLRSDLSVADGISLVMLGRLLGANLPERVTGSDLFEQLAQARTDRPIKVFFFGGPPGAGRRAAEQLNQNFTGMTCVGYHEAGFGSVESMSTPEIIASINASGADFVVAALGAKKGQAWILHNQHLLEAPVISHLGAVINFMAGTVRRSPRWLQRIGLEWIWRIFEEPALWRRYWEDGLVFLSLLARHALPTALAERRARQQVSKAGRIVSDRHTSQGRLLMLSGRWTQVELSELKAALHELQTLTVKIDMSHVTWIDARALGLLAGLHGRLLAEGGQGVTLCNVPRLLQRQIDAAGASYLIEIPPMNLVGAKA